MKKTKKYTKSSIIFLELGSLDYPCPYCGTIYHDTNDELVERMNKAKNNCARPNCLNCGNNFWAVIDMTGRNRTFKLKTNTR